MRPIVRGNWPKNDQGEDIQFSDYTEARAELIRRLGEYCSYCEMHLDASLAVEHVQPKKPPGANNIDQTRFLNWNNFLLACTNCNATKGNTDVVLEHYLWPDQDNTFRALQYLEGGLVAPASDGDLRKKAQNTIRLLGLDKTPLNDPRASDRRWNNRRETWDIAQRSRARLLTCNTVEMRAQIVDSATGRGYWSVWMTVFQDDPDMRQRLINSFDGTCAACFDAVGTPVAREGGQC